MLVWFKAFLTTLMQPYQLKMDSNKRILYLLFKIQSGKCSSIQVRQSIPRVPRNMLSTVKVSSVPTMIYSDKSNLECLKNTASKSALLGSNCFILQCQREWSWLHQRGDWKPIHTGLQCWLEMSFLWAFELWDIYLLSYFEDSWQMFYQLKKSIPTWAKYQKKSVLAERWIITFSLNHDNSFFYCISWFHLHFFLYTWRRYTKCYFPSPFHVLHHAVSFHVVFIFSLFRKVYETNCAHFRFKISRRLTYIML